MLNNITKRIFGTPNDRYIKNTAILVENINQLEEKIQKYTDEELQKSTQELKESYKSGKTLEELLPESFAIVREASKRMLEQRHYDVQLIGGIALHQGKVTEMKTGEGKTLVSTLPAYLNAISGNGVHIVTVNDYLAKRDSQWMGKIYKFLGLTVGCVTSGISDEDRKAAYNCDITYSTNNELGFDFLRDNMKFEMQQMVQRPFNFAIVDEVDSILIDEARTPLIISGPTEDNSALYNTINDIIPKLKNEDVDIDEKSKSVSLTEIGNEHVEAILSESLLIKDQNLYDPSNINIVHHINQGIKAHKLFEKDKDYIVNDGKVVIIDEFTGRMMEGRRYADGLHQALEAKEKIIIQNENQTLATVTFQNYFRMYPKLSGMTGTASTEAEELIEIYNLEVISIPTHKHMIRLDQNDEVYRTAEEKWEAVINDIKMANKKNQPVLVGTTSIEKSEMLSNLLKKHKINHNVLNARYHEEEANIIAQAGIPKSVTIATNMAGRGTDIVLGGNPDSLNLSQTQWELNHKEILDLGGLHIIGTERHEARRIDNQLRGRAGRQGDPGNSRFFVALDDDLMRRFGGDTIRKFMDMAGIDKDVPIENQMITRQIESAQVKVEGYHFDIRKNLVEYDDVANAHRSVIYSEREKILNSENLTVHIFSIVEKEILEVVGNYTSGLSKVEWDLPGLLKEVSGILHNSHVVPRISELQNLESDQIQVLVSNAYQELYKDTENSVGLEQMREFEKQLLLHIIDGHWVYHLTAMENLRQGIGLQAVGQRDPLVSYKKEAHDQFQDLLARIEHDVVRGIFSIRDSINSSLNSRPNTTRNVSKKSIMSEVVERQNTIGKDTKSKVGRNEKCPCGSGRKFKKCHGGDL